MNRGNSHIKMVFRTNYFDTKEFNISPVVGINNEDYFFEPVPKMIQEQSIRLRPAKIVLNDNWLTDMFGA